jgi:hypothetical protein
MVARELGVSVHCPLSDDGERISKLISYLAFLER